MKKIAICLLSLSACLLMAPAASATWGGFISTGNATGIGNPSCAPVSTGHVAGAVRSGKSVIMVNEFSGTKWGMEEFGRGGQLRSELYERWNRQSVLRGHRHQRRPRGHSPKRRAMEHSHQRECSPVFRTQLR
jgi:hypothetical protein